MKVPFFPVEIDYFHKGGSGSDRASHSGSSTVYLLSHYHTDHMKGLAEHWEGAPLVTSVVTARLLASQYGPQSPVAQCVVALPLWSRTELLLLLAAEPQAPTSSIYVTLVPSYHIPGSVMFYFETPLGHILYTGDFKFCSTARSALQPFFQTHPVDHLYLDDTWLHLGYVVPGGDATLTARGGNQNHNINNDGSKVLSKLLGAEEVAEVIEAIGRRFDYYMCNQHTMATAPTDQRRGKPPFVLRVYLHNQFGKELLIQRLAERLRTTVLLDDRRYARLEVACSAMRDEQQHGDDGEGHRWTEAQLYPVDMRYFMSYSQHRKLLAEAMEEESDRYEVTAALPRIEVVSTRAAVSPQALCAARAASSGCTAYFGVIVSGWARLQASKGAAGPSGSDLLWHIPTTLHCTPQEIIDFVSLLRPASVTPLHYRASRGTVMMMRLGPHLRSPCINNYMRATPDVLRWGQHGSWRCALTTKPHDVVDGSPIGDMEAPAPALGYRLVPTVTPRGPEAEAEGLLGRCQIESLARSRAKRRRDDDGSGGANAALRRLADLLEGKGGRDLFCRRVSEEKL